MPEELFALLDDDEVDLLVRPGPVPEHHAPVPIAQEEVVLTTPRDHPLARQDAVRLDDLDGVPLVHFGEDNALRAWLDRSLAEAAVRPEVVMRTSVTTAAPQLAAAGLGVAVTPISAVGAGTGGAVRSFTPRWTRHLVAITRPDPSPLATRFVADLRKRGLRIPREVQAQLTPETDPGSALP